MRTRARRTRSPAGRRLNAACGGSLAEPLLHPALLLWLSADGPLYQERSSPATPASADGDPVGTWNPSAGTAVGTAPTDPRRGLLKLIGGRRYVRLQAAGGGFATGLDVTGACTVFAVGKPGADGTANRRTVQSAVVNAVVSITDRNDVNQFFFTAPVSGTDATGDPRSVALVVPAAGNCVAYLNGADVTTAPVGRADFRTVCLGDVGTNTEAGDCDVRHVLVYNAALSAAEVLALHRWGVAS